MHCLLSTYFVLLLYLLSIVIYVLEHCFLALKMQDIDKELWIR